MQLYGNINNNDIGCGVKQPNPPGLTDLATSIINHVMKLLNCHQVGIIKEFDTGTQTATVQIAIKRLVQFDSQGGESWQEYTLLVDCPCIVISGGAGSLQMPISEGDECLILFNDREIDNWFASGAVSKTNSKRVHDLSDGICLVGIKSLANAFAGYANDAVKLAYGDSFVKLKALSATMQSDGVINLTAPIINLSGNIISTGFGAIPGIHSFTYFSKSENAITNINFTAGQRIFHTATEEIRQEATQISQIGKVVIQGELWVNGVRIG